MKAESIVCFAKNWTDNPTSCTHVLRHLAHENQVLWLNSIASRAPRLSSARDWRTIARKLSLFARGPEAVAPNLTVLTPLVLPLPHSRRAAGINRSLLRAYIGRERRRLGLGDFQAWTFLPTTGPLMGTLGESLSVYYCTDEWAQFTAVDGGRMEAQERDLVEKVDIVFAAARSLVEKKRALNPETHLIPHGVDRDHFARALEAETAVPEDVRHLPRPMIGFFGLVEDWIDVELFAYLARQRPRWSVVVIGQVHVPVEHLLGIPNLHFLGRRSYADLPRYAKAFSVGICPFRVNGLTVHVNPIKLREYLSAGLPVVSTDIPECRVREDLGRVAVDHEGFLAAVEGVLAADSEDARRRRSEAMRAETWEARVREIGEHVMRVKEAKGKRARVLEGR